MNAFAVSFGDFDKVINQAKEKVGSQQHQKKSKQSNTAKDVKKSNTKNHEYKLSSGYVSFEKLDLLGKRVVLSNGIEIEFHPTTAREREKFGYYEKVDIRNKLVKHNDYVALVVVYMNGASKYKGGRDYLYQYVTSWHFDHPHDIKKWFNQGYDLFKMEFLRFFITPNNDRYIWIKSLTPDPYLYYSDYYDDYEESFDANELASDLNRKTDGRPISVSEFKVIGVEPTSRESSQLFSDAEFQKSLKQTRAQLAKGR